MKKQYYRIGTIEESEWKKDDVQLVDNRPVDDRWGFSDGVIMNDTIYIPLESLAKKLEIPIEDMFCQELMEAYKKYKIRTGVWPIRAFDPWVESILTGIEKS